MVDIEGFKFERQSDRLYIHFDVSGHFLKLDTFIETAQQAQRIVDALNQSFFDGKLDYELIVLAPESGTFLTKLALYVSGGVAAVFAFLNTDIGKAYVEGLTGHEPAHWALQIGESHREKLEDASEWIEEQSQPGATSDEEACKVGAKVVVELTRGVLQREKSELERLVVSVGNLPDALEARSEFYKACIADPDIKGIGFTPAKDFPIPRNSFPERAVTSARREDEDDPLPWSVAIEEISATSPNWDKNDQTNRKWKGKDSIKRDCFFIIEDEGFWLHARNRNLTVEVVDILRVQWAFQSIEGRITNRRVLRVLEFNSEKLADPLSPDAIQAILGQFSDGELETSQGLLF